VARTWDLGIAQFPRRTRLVPITARASASQSTYLRNYIIRNEPSAPITIVDACIATLSKPSHFEPVLFRHRGAAYEYISGDPNFPNPIREWIADAYSLDKEAGVSCILSIGASESTIIRVPDKFESVEWKYYQESALGDGERTAREIALQLGHLDIYYRLRVTDSLTLGPNRFEIMSDIRFSARNYVNIPEFKAKVARCAESLKLRICTSTIEMLCKFLFQSDAIYADCHLDRSGGGKFTAPGLPPLSNHFVLRKEPWDRIVQTVIGEEDMEAQGQRILVISGLGGCGKTQLAIKFAKVFGSRYVP
jgi:hypothetical protein